MKISFWLTGCAACGFGSGLFYGHSRAWMVMVLLGLGIWMYGVGERIAELLEMPKGEK